MAAAESCVISVAITGSVPRKRDNPAPPVAVPGQTESTHAAYEDGAAPVAQVARMAAEHGRRPVATARQARRMLGLPASPTALA